MTKIIINADDYGFCDEVDAGVRMAAEQGLINSVATFVNGPDWANRLAVIKAVQSNYNCDDSKVQGIDIGCHLSITSGKPVSRAAINSDFLTKKGRFRKYTQLKRPETVEGKKALKAIVKGEIMAQLDRMDKAQIDIAHLSSHHDTLTFFEDYFEAVLEVGQQNKIPVRSPIMLPKSKEKIYYNQVGLRLKNNLSTENEQEYTEFRKGRHSWFADNFGSYTDIPNSPSFLDGSNYITKSQIFDVNNSQRQKETGKSKSDKVYETIQKQDASSTTEYVVHLCSPTADIKGKMKFEKKKIKRVPNPNYYSGVNAGYFDGRQIEFEALKSLKTKLFNDPSIIITPWNGID